MKSFNSRAYGYCGVGRKAEGSQWVVGVDESPPMIIEHVEEALCGNELRTNGKVEETYRIRKVLTMDPSTPVTKDGPISHGNVVDVGFTTSAWETDGCGTSKEIWVMASWSSTSNEVNLRHNSLINQR